MKIIFLIIGWIALILGLIGIALPVMPTTPFIILAAYCFARSSKKLHDRLLKHPVFGPVIIAWEQRGAIPRKAKIISTVMISISVVTTFIFTPRILAIPIFVILVGAVTFIWSRPD